jgi:hypothetical protein
MFYVDFNTSVLPKFSWHPYLMPSPQGSRGLNPLNSGGVRAWLRDGSERSSSTRLEWYMFEWNFDIVSASPTLRDVSFSPALRDVSVSPALSSLLDLGCWTTSNRPRILDRPQICDLGNPLSLESEETTSPLPLRWGRRELGFRSGNESVALPSKLVVPELLLLPVVNPVTWSKPPDLAIEKCLQRWRKWSQSACIYLPSCILWCIHVRVYMLLISRMGAFVQDRKAGSNNQQGSHRT